MIVPVWEKTIKFAFDIVFLQCLFKEITWKDIT